MASENGSGSVSSVPAAAAAKRFWRTVAIASLVLFLVGTHWPKLRLPEVEGGPASDKLIHFIAFALLAVPVWWTGWFSRLRWLLVAGTLFAIFDEITQELLPIDRFANLDDLLSDLSGLFASVSILASLRATGSDASRGRHSMRRSASNLLLSKPVNLANLTVAAALGMVVLVPVGVLLAPVVLIDVKVLAIAAAGVGAAGGGLLALEAGTRATLRRVRNARTCPFCLAEPCEPPVCIACSKPIAAAMWSAPPTIALASRLRAAWLPSVRSLVALTALVAVVHLVPVVTRPLENLEPITVLALDLMAVAIALAWSIHGTRVRLDRLLGEWPPAATSRRGAHGVGLLPDERGESMPR